MAYFSRKQDGIERGCKVAADIFSALLPSVFSVVSITLCQAKITQRVPA
jgi:hypothetical protein